MHLANADLKIEPVERTHAAISLGQPDRAQRHVTHIAVIPPLPGRSHQR